MTVTGFSPVKRFRMPSHTFPRASSEANWAISAEQNVTHRKGSPPPQKPTVPFTYLDLNSILDHHLDLSFVDCTSV